MSERLTALGMSVLAACFVFLAVHSVSRADESNKGQSAGAAKASEEVTAGKGTSAPEETGDACPVARIRAALDRPICVEFVETPLEDVVAGLDKYQIPVLLDRRALDDMGIGADVPITRSVKGVRVATLLDLVLTDLDLTWVIHDEVLLITTQEQAACMQETRVLEVADLVGGDKDIARLAALIQTVIDPATWDAVGGPASIGFVETADIRALVIAQTPRIHDKITALLADLRSHLREFPAETCAAQVSAGASLQEALARKTSVEFVETPLADAIAELEQRLRFEVEIDHRSLNDMGIGCDTPVTRRLSGISIESALDLLLRDLDLTFTTKDNILLILTKEAEACDLRVKVYPVGDLTKDAPHGVDHLATTVKKTVAPTSWDEVGGPAAIVPCENAGMKVLVVSQTWNVHRKIERLLADLHSARHSQGGPSADKQADSARNE